MADQPVSPNALLDKGYVTLEEAPKSLPVTANTLLEKGYAVLEPPLTDRPVTANMLLDMGYVAVLLGPHVRDRFPYGTRNGQSPHGLPVVEISAATMGFEIFTNAPRTIDTTTIIVQVQVNWGAPELVYDGSAGGYQAGYTGTAVPGSTSLEDFITFSFDRDAGFVARDFVRVLVFADDDLGQSIDPPEFFEFQIGSVGSVVAITPNPVANDGGTLITVALTDVPDGDYNMHIGPLGTVLDPKMYSGVSGQGDVITVANGSFTAVVPILPIGGPYEFTSVEVPSGLVEPILNPLLVVVAHDFRTRMLSYRGLLPRTWLVGYRRPDGEDFPQS